jgi:hypothetical protein
MTTVESCRLKLERLMRVMSLPTGDGPDGNDPEQLKKVDALLSQACSALEVYLGPWPSDYSPREYRF